MPITIPRLDDRTYDDLAQELVARIPAHTPEWTSPRAGDPGRTLIELFAWLGDTLLYRANLIPERQRLVFLRLLGMQLRPATPARGMVSLRFDDPTVTARAMLQPRAKIAGPVPFESTAEITVVPAIAECYIKRPLSSDEVSERADVLTALREVYDLGGSTPAFYATKAVFADGAPDTAGVDVAATLDGALWIALLANKPPLLGAVRDALGGTDGTPTILNVGVAPAIEVPSIEDAVTTPASVLHAWESSGPDNADGTPAYHALAVSDDTTAGLTRPGVVRLVLPAAKDLGASSNDVQTLSAGLGDRPPRLDDPDRAARLVAWIRLRLTEKAHALRISWVGINALEIEQRTTTVGQIVGTSTGAADQTIFLGTTSVDPASLAVEVEETSLGFVPWQRVDDLVFAGRDSAAYALDAEAGTIRFGDGVRGRIPDAGRRVRVAQLRAGGGVSGNLPPGALRQIAAIDLTGRPPAQSIKVAQALPTFGGADAETLRVAEGRIPSTLRHGDRAVTADDWRRLAAETPGVTLGRVEVLPRFKPQQKRDGVPGVVSVMVVPFKADTHAPNPRADRRTLEAVFAYLDGRRLLGTELYVIGCDYVGIGLSIAIRVRDGFGATQVLSGVREALFAALCPLATGPMNPSGWPLGRSVRDRELEVFVAQVPGVASVAPVNLFTKNDAGFQIVVSRATTIPGGIRTGLPRRDVVAEVALSPWQLPELLAVVVELGDEASLTVATAADGGGNTIAVPTAPEVC